MANNFYVIDRSKRYGQAVDNVAAILAQAVARLQGLKNVADNMTDGITYAVVEAQFGLAPGKGADLVFLLSNALTKLQDPVIGQFIAYLGGVAP
jgi:hypothetical protein